MSTVATAELASCRGVSVVHRQGSEFVRALQEVELTIADRERVALVGPSGSGKTTLLHVLGGLVRPDAGEVLWRGGPLSSLDAAARGAARAGGIAFVFQGANLLPTLTVFENVSFAQWASRDEGHEGRDDPDPAALLALVGLEQKLDALPGELSGGEAQRVAIARALAQRPMLLLCDEPTGQLDSDTSKRVLDLIDALHEHFGFAQLIATHSSEVAARLGRVINLADGRVLNAAEAT
ncbi:MAG TPA: ABC transporter ATP-binding protein [Solirubrobacteraceae bacterium]